MKWVFKISLMVCMWGIYGGLEKKKGDEDVTDFFMFILTLLCIVG